MSITSSAALALGAMSPQCRGCGPDYLMITFVVLWISLVPWLVGSSALVVTALLTRPPGYEAVGALVAAAVIPVGLAILLFTSSGFASDSVITGSEWGSQTLLVIGCALRWRSLRRRRTRSVG